MDDSEQRKNTEHFNEMSLKKEVVLDTDSILKERIFLDNLSVVDVFSFVFFFLILTFSLLLLCIVIFVIIFIFILVNFILQLLEQLVIVLIFAFFALTFNCRFKLVD